MQNSFVRMRIVCAEENVFNGIVIDLIANSNNGNGNVVAALSENNNGIKTSSYLAVNN